MQVQILTVSAQLHQRSNPNGGSVRTALEILQKAEDEANKIINDIRAAISEHRTSSNSKEIDDQPADVGMSKGKGKAQGDIDDTDSVDYEDMPRNAADEERLLRQRALQARLRECQITLHRVHFLKGDTYHALGEAYIEAENTAYATAEDLRKILLKSVLTLAVSSWYVNLIPNLGTEQTAKRAMAYLAQDARENGISEKELYIEVPYIGPGGIRSHDLVSS